ncbi:hypothetical protein KC851_04370 [Candidatus Kaiserbacteria bacterium]|nr:hypothetical protein [Candidatus Kaiserbacteria bacterium]
MEKITLQLFWTFMLLCAATFTTGIWLGDHAPEALFKTGGTFFIVGLANFLLWAPQVIYRFLQTLGRN